MKFVLSVEENGYELRFWDELNEEVGSLLMCDWDLKRIFKNLQYLNFDIKFSDAYKIEDLLQIKHFVLLTDDSTDEQLIHRRLEIS